MSKTLRLHGPRRFRRTREVGELQPAEPVDSLPLDYRHAFGGCWSARRAPAGRDGDVLQTRQPRRMRLVAGRRCDAAPVARGAGATRVGAPTC
jgi:hypothetical protein